jgi:hypothetical protein
VDEMDKVREADRFTVFCKDYRDGIDYLLSKYENYPNPIDDWREYEGEYGKIVVIMTPIGDLWIFEVEHVEDEYAVKLIGSSYALREWISTFMSRSAQP